MTKNDAIDLFGTPLKLSCALNITRQAVYQWPDELPTRLADEITGAALRLKKFRWHCDETQISN